jgi:glycyl-tRNA synthetase
LTALYKKYDIKSEQGNPLSEPKEFNLIFETQIGPQGGMKGYLRPETAQGIFVNFKKLIEYNNGRMPFAAAQLGLGFRNEISPRSGLLRVREFPMAEIEHFLDPQNKVHPKIGLVADFCIPLLSAQSQMTESPVVLRDMKLKDAIEKGMIKNQTLAYYMARTYLFLQLCGIPIPAIRFREHMKNEMAFYAQECWDAEVECSYGWTEVAGHADRGCHDLTCHSKGANEELTAARLLKEPKMVKTTKVVCEKKKMGPKYGKDTGAILAKLEHLDEAELKSVAQLIAEKKEVFYNPLYTGIRSLSKFLRKRQSCSILP